MLIESKRSTSATQELVISGDYKINEAAFGSNGSWLCAWALGPDRDCPSRSYHWGVENWPPDPSERRVGIKNLSSEYETVRKQVSTFPLII